MSSKLKTKFSSEFSPTHSEDPFENFIENCEEISSTVDQKGNSKNLSMETMDEFTSQLEDFHRFAVQHKMQFMTYLLEMAYIEALNVMSSSKSKTVQKH